MMLSWYTAGLSCWRLCGFFLLSLADGNPRMPLPIPQEGGSTTQEHLAHCNKLATLSISIPQSNFEAFAPLGSGLEPKFPTNKDSGHISHMIVTRCPQLSACYPRHL
eukprot:3407438-Amphidinium_carterae.2